MGMAPLAAFLADDGNSVSGFDDTPDPDVAAYLLKHSVPVGATARDLSGFDAVVISSALKRRRRELEELGAKRILLRGECWAQVCQKRRLAAIVGSHGKSTVSAMCAHAIDKFGLDAGWLVGAVPNGFEMHRHCADGKILFSEIDESDGTIENFSPEFTAALNADLDHTDTYADWRKLGEMFRRLFARTKKLVVYPQSDAFLAEIAAEFPKKSVPVPTSGDFNKTNAALARALLERVFDTPLPKDAFGDFAGTRRRQETIFADANLTVMADYAHHPNEVSAFLKFFENGFPDARRVVVFQPHRYSRTKTFARDFAEILDKCSQNAAVVIAPVYAASEPFDPEGTSEKIAGLCKNKSIKLAKDGEVFNIVKSLINDGGKCAAAFVGAGDLYFGARKFFKGTKCQK